MEKERVQKILSERGYCSRRKAEDLIRAGRVTIDGETAVLGAVCLPDAAIAVDGKTVLGKSEEKHTYLLLNKPRGYICTLDDPQGRKTVLELVPERYGRLFPVGRLDLDSSGLLILTDDGDFSNLVMHPSSSPEKEYVVTVKNPYRGDEPEKIAKGLYIVREGYTAAPAKCRLLKEGKDGCTFSVILHEGKKREVRRMMQTLDHPVLTLNRVRIGNVVLGRLKPGETREMTNKEVQDLLTLCKENKAGKKKRGVL